ncbi:MAG: flagellar M-ring protein FliF C-terminal domain-containing protein [Phycisphaerales bacterium]
MGRFKGVIETIQDYFGRLSVTQKLLVSSLVVIMLMTLFVVQQYASATKLTPVLPGATAEDQDRAMTSLVSSGFRPSLRNGEVMVKPNDVHRARAYLVETGTAPADTSIMFNNLAENWSWTMPSEQQSKLEIIATQNELEKIIAAMSDVNSAKVILNLPAKRTLGSPRTKPSAMVTVWPVLRLDQKMVDSIANLVSSSRGIGLDQIRVIDAVNGKHFSARNDADYTATNYLEYVAAIEDRKYAQLMDLFAYIPGVNISIHAQVDNTRAEKQTTSYLQEGNGTVVPLTSEMTQESDLSRAARGGEPGVRSNVGASVAGTSAAQGDESSESQTETTFSPNVGSEREVVVDPRGRPTKINAIVNIPRPYFAAIWKQRQRAENPETPENEIAAPTDNDLDPIVQTETTRITAEVEKLIDTSAPPEGGDQFTGEVFVSMIPSAEDLGFSAGDVSGAGSLLGIPMGTINVQNSVKTVGLGALAVLSLVMLVMTATKAAKREELPSAEELVGIPKELDENDEVIGEALEADAALDGLELTDEDLRRRSIAEQVSELVAENPGDAARLLSKWIADDSG